MMTRRTFQTGLLLAASGSHAFGAEAQGSWSGVLDAGSKRLRLKLEIESDGHGTNVRATVPHLAIARLAQAGDCRPVTASACAGACA